MRPAGGTATVRPKPRRVLVLGTGPLARLVIREIEAHRRHTVVGMLAETGDARTAGAGVPLLGPIDSLGSILSQTAAGRIVVAMNDRRGRLPVQQLLEARVRGIVVEDGAEVLERLAGKIAIESVSPGALAFAEFRCSPLHQVLARLLSVLIAGAALILFAPLILLLALVIKLDSPGPVLFVQERAGLGGRRFRLLKLRTMRPARGPASAWVRDNGHRITRAGRWLRRFRLDELPQFVNILRGDMNLIGPRPHPLSNFDLFARTVPYYWIRSRVRPGATGWAQVRYGYANDLEEETEKMRYDLYYIKHRSLGLDLRILLETFRVVLLGRSAEEAGTPQPVPDRATNLAFLPRLRSRHDAGGVLAGGARR